MTERSAATVPAIDGEAPDEPFLRVVRGNPTPDEIAAVVVMLLAWARQETPQPDPGPRSAWADPATLLRRPRYPR